MQSQDHADFWRKRAEEAHSVAQGMVDATAKRHMHFIAQAYVRLADHAGRTATRKQARQTP